MLTAATMAGGQIGNVQYLYPFLPWAGFMMMGTTPWRPVVVLGQTALFFYVLHVQVFKLAALVLGLYKSQGLGVTAIAWLILLAALYPLCRWYLGVKRRYPHSALRFL